MSDIIHRIRQAFSADAATVGEIEQLIADARLHLDEMRSDAESEHKKALDLTTDDPTSHRLSRDRLRAEIERLDAAVQQLQSSTLPEAIEREEQAERLLNYNHAKEHLAAALERDSEFDRRFSWLRATMEVNEQVRAEIASVNSSLPVGSEPIECPLPLSTIAEQVLSKEQVLCWCDAGTTNLVSDNQIREVADTRMHGRKDGGTLVHRHVASKITLIPTHSRLEQPAAIISTTVGARIETLALEQQQALLADELDQSTLVAIRMGKQRMTVSRHDLAYYTSKGAEIETIENSQRRIRVIR